ncbi:polymorphic toxin-type HINT domain-containing protein [Actinoplanes solisilvae]|uniref:polymorphic toxin-type HINT domain-containing protein n=1 Tax=Actinoplanes solisilvae TaxID=2486853 RepID=UPI000FDC08E7|nr:polymorphic toxin-type HINT domain-containing protein [Actinoplanes solisilvae]
MASRTTANRSLTWLFSDHQGTQQVAVNAYTQQVNIRRQTPYGETRGTNAAWPNGKGFVGGDIDPTGLIHVGAREYDPTLGRFISVDPIQDLTDPQQWNAYTYTGNDPINQSDPTGLRTDDQYYGPVGAAKIENNAAQEADRIGHAKRSGDYSAVPYAKPGYSPPKAGGDHKPKPKKQPWYKRATDWVSENQNQLWGAAVGIAAYAGCTALTGGTGVIGCLAVGGAAANLTTNILDGNIHSAGDVAESLIVGGVQGALSIPLAAVDMVSQTGAAVDALADGDYAGALGHGALAALDATAVVGGPKAMGGKGKPLTNSRGRTPKKCSFTPSTLVLLANGAAKPISEIQVGDKVLATDLDTDTTEAKTVEVLFDNLDTNLVDLVVSVDGHQSIVHTTANHPFWDETAQAWINAGDLSSGHQLLTPDGVSAVAVAVRRFFGARRMLNLTVADFHTYYVIADATPVLVHNCDFGPGEADIHYDKHALGLDDAGQPTRKADMAEYSVCPAGAQETVRTLDGQSTVIRLDSKGRVGMRVGDRITTYFRPDNPRGFFDQQANR